MTKDEKQALTEVIKSALECVEKTAQKLAKTRKEIEVTLALLGITETSD